MAAVAAGTGRLSAAFGYLTMFFMFILAWFIIVYIIEFFFNVLVTAAIQVVFPAASVPILNLPDPLELLRDALTYFGQLFNIGSVILYGFIETVTFGAMILFGILGAFMGPNTPFNRIKDFLMGVQQEAERKRK